MEVKAGSNLYLDVCCLNRPFDYQGDSKIRLETEAILIILDHIEKGVFNFIKSDIIDYEVNKILNENRKSYIDLILSLVTRNIELDDSIVYRAKQFESYGIKTFDALHLSCAENNTELFLTVDKNIIKKSENIKDLNIVVTNPIDFLEEFLGV